MNKFLNKMKLIILTVISLCMALGHAQPLATPAPWNAALLTIMDEMAQIGENAVKVLAHQYEEIVLEPQQQLEEAVEKVETRRQENPECVANEDEEILTIVDTAHEELHNCGMTAALDSAEIVSDVNEATEQLVFGGYALGRTYNTCQNYKNPVLKQSCLAKFYVQLTKYLVSATTSLKTIAQSTNERIPAVFMNGNVCTHGASAKAVEALDVVSSHIDSCIARKH